MELRDLGLRILEADSLADKIAPPGEPLSDGAPGESVAWRLPHRPPGLGVAPKSVRHRKMPHPQSLHEARLRVRVLHAFANHELMALEMMAWALLAFPEAPSWWRQDLAGVLLDEQRHLRMYCNRIAQLGACFGDLPLNGHFFRCAPHLRNPLQFSCTMNLTFEQANLDHALAWSEHFEAAGDQASAAIVRKIWRDEIAHVGFGARTLAAHTPEGESSFELYLAQLGPETGAERARARDRFEIEARQRAGLDADFIARLMACG